MKRDLPRLPRFNAFIPGTRSGAAATGFYLSNFEHGRAGVGKGELVFYNFTLLNGTEVINIRREYDPGCWSIRGRCSGLWWCGRGCIVGFKSERAQCQGTTRRRRGE